MGLFKTKDDVVKKPSKKELKKNKKIVREQHLL